MLEFNEQLKLVKAAVNGKASPVAYSYGEEKYSYDEVNELLRREMNELAKDYNTYQRNKHTIFALIAEGVDDYLPKKVLDQYGQFAEVRTFAQGDKPVFVQKVTEASKRRAKQFITKVGPAGRYEVFKLDGKKYEVPVTAYGGAAQIGFEEFLDGRVDFAELMEVINEGLEDAVYLEIEKALIGAVTSLQTNNKHTASSFEESAMDKLVAVADSYGRATIYCTYEFAATMIPSTGWVSDNMRDAKWNNGYLGNYKGHQVIVLEQSYTDETNSTKVIDPAYAWIIPNGAGEKPVKVAFEGTTQVKEFENRDWSREIQTYTKFGVAATITNNICVYINSSLTK